jgi:ribosomal protein S21
MLIVKLDGKKPNIEKALKKLKSKVIRTKQLRKLREDSILQNLQQRKD